MILITGATGLVGGHLLIHLLQKEKSVRALRRTSSSFEELKLIYRFYQISFEQVMQQTEWVTGDLSDKESLDWALTGVRTVYHCAAIVSFAGSSSEKLIQTNVEGTRNLAEAAFSHHVSVFAFVSSIGALGQSQNNAPIDEETPWNIKNTSSVYSNSKYAAEQEVWKASARGLPVVIVNPGIVLGAGDSSKGSLQLYSLVKKGIPFYTFQKSGYVDVRDVCKAMLLLVERQIVNERFVLVSECLTNKELFTLIAKAINRKPPYIPIGRIGLQFAGYIEKLFTFFTGKTPLITPEIIRSASKQETYSSEKIQQATGFTFIPMEDSIKEAAKLMKE